MPHRHAGYPFTLYERSDSLRSGCLDAGLLVVSRTAVRRLQQANTQSHYRSVEGAHRINVLFSEPNERDKPRQGITARSLAVVGLGPLASNWLNSSRLSQEGLRAGECVPEQSSKFRRFDGLH